jgi:hypothetical protein
VEVREKLKMTNRILLDTDWTKRMQSAAKYLTDTKVQTKTTKFNELFMPQMINCDVSEVKYPTAVKDNIPVVP